jgi:hypothetical protein
LIPHDAKAIPAATTIASAMPRSDEIGFEAVAEKTIHCKETLPLPFACDGLAYLVYRSAPPQAKQAGPLR